MFFRYAGVGAEFKTTSVIEVDGVPPLLKNVSILYSAYNGINITTSDSILDLQDCIIKNNRGIKKKELHQNITLYLTFNF
jgi:hypothetical protein